MTKADIAIAKAAVATSASLAMLRAASPTDKSKFMDSGRPRKNPRERSRRGIVERLHWREVMVRKEQEES
jgi:hypothetical protein